MSSYFPIPPSIYINELSLNINGSTTFLNVPNNQLKQSKVCDKNSRNIIYLGIFSLERKNWRLIKVIPCNPYEFIEVNRNDLSVKNEQMVVMVPKKINNFPLRAKYLPHPDSLRIDRSLVAERCSLNFSIKKAYSSYQGEYPLEMCLSKKGSFLTFDTLKEFTNDEVLNYIILMNIFRDSSFQNKVKIDIIDPTSNKFLGNIYAKRNSFSIHKILKENVEIEKNQTRFYRSNECTFIPIFLSIDLKTCQLSVEHTHPPTEMIHGARKFEVIKYLKKSWC